MILSMTIKLRVCIFIYICVCVNYVNYMYVQYTIYNTHDYISETACKVVVYRRIPHPPIVSNCETGPGKFRFLLQVMVAAMKTKQSSEIGPVVAPAGLVKPWHLDSTPKYLDLWM